MSALLREQRAEAERHWGDGTGTGDAVRSGSGAGDAHRYPDGPGTARHTSTGAGQTWGPGVCYP